MEKESTHAQVVELINRYFAAIDDKCLDLAVVESTFAPTGKVVRPNGAEMVGPAAICSGQNESFARFRATHHVMTNHVVDLLGEHARVRANVIATHLWAPGHGDPIELESHFTAGERSPSNWCTSRQAGASLGSKTAWCGEPVRASLRCWRPGGSKACGDHAN